MRGCQAPRSPFRKGVGGEAHARTKVRAWERRFVPAKRLAGVGKRLVRIAKRLAAVTKPLAWVAKRLAAIGKSLASVGMEGAGPRCGKSVIIPNYSLRLTPPSTPNAQRNRQQQAQRAAPARHCHRRRPARRQAPLRRPRSRHRPLRDEYTAILAQARLLEAAVMGDDSGTAIEQKAGAKTQLKALVLRLAATL